MLGMASNIRMSHIYLGSDKNKPLIIIRKFNNFEEAEQLINNMKNFSNSKNIELLNINKQNYQIVLKQQSIMAYKEFYKKLAKE